MEKSFDHTAVTDLLTSRDGQDYSETIEETLCLMDQSERLDLIKHIIDTDEIEDPSMREKAINRICQTTKRNKNG